MSVQRLLSVVKQAGSGAVEAGSPVNVIFGEVVTASPISIRVDQRFTLTAEFLVLTSATKEMKVNIGGTDYLVRAGLQSGDKVILLRVQGGQQYVVLDKVVSV